MDTKQNPTSGVVDPVCGMTVNPATASDSVGHDGENYYFCCRQCAEKFKAAPAQCLNKAAKPMSGLVTLGMPSPAVPSAVNLKDPVYGMDVAPPRPSTNSMRRTVILFCSELFGKISGNPAKWLDKSQLTKRSQLPVRLPMCPKNYVNRSPCLVQSVE
jgi:YHS domain-containing protein